MGKKNIVWLAEANSGYYDDYAKWVEGVFATPEAAMIYVDTEYENEYRVGQWSWYPTAEAFVTNTISKYENERVFFRILPTEVQS